MASYGAKTYESGFYNSADDVEDRVYNAEQLSDFYSGIFTNGICPDEEGKIGDYLAVYRTTGMTIRVTAGKGLFGHKYFWNKSNFMITLDNPTPIARYDAIVIRVDRSELVRNTDIIVKSFDHVPTIADLERTEDIQEYMIAYAMIQGEYLDIPEGVIFDTRMDQSVCGLITSLYRELDSKAIHQQWEETFNNWLNTIKNKLVGNATLSRLYQSYYITTVENEKVIPIGISQYEKDLDSLMVHVNGLTLNRESGYTIIDDEHISLTLPLPVVGTVVSFEVLKSIEGSQANTVVNEVRVLQEQVTTLEKKGKYIYNCNGKTDNVEISKLVRAFLEADTNNSDYGSYTIYVNGVFGYTQMASGTGIENGEYHFIEAGLGTLRNRKVVLDFANCSFIFLDGIEDKYYTVFYGMNVNVKNANISCTGRKSTFHMFSEATSSSNTCINVENCRFWITAKDKSYIANSGTFRNCLGLVINNTINSYCFEVDDKSLLRIIGGEYYAYTSYSSGDSSVVYVPETATNGVVITYGMNCPHVTKGAYYQNSAIKCLSNNAKCSFTDTITTLPITATGQTVRSTIVANKPNMM